MTHTRSSKRRGFVLLTTTLSLPILFGIMGLAVDVAFLRYTELILQAGADAAALAATREIGNLNAAVQQAGQSAAAANGFANGSNGVTVQVNNPPASGSFAGNTNYAEAVITQNRPALFMRVLGFGGATVAARAVAGLTSVYGGCIYALDPADEDALVVTGSAQVSSNCGVYVNSSNPKALQVTGSGCLTADGGGINVVGGDSGSKSCVSPAVTKGVNHIADPLGDIPAPVWSGCDHAGQVSISNGTVTLDPGVYCGGISISGGTIRFNPGIYILNGGGLAVSSATTSITGTDVMFYNTGDAGHSFEPVDIRGGASLRLTAPTSGTYRNLLIFEDRAKGGASVENKFTGNSSMEISGALYFPNSRLTFTGDTTTNQSTALIAAKLTFTGNSYIRDGLNGAGNSGTGGSTGTLAE